VKPIEQQYCCEYNREGPIHNMGYRSAEFSKKTIKEFKTRKKQQQNKITIIIILMNIDG